MRTPLVAYDGETVDLFETVRDAELYLEPPDIEELKMFDADGYEVRVGTIEEDVPMFLGLFKTKRSRVVVEGVACELPRRDDDLHTILSDYIGRLRPDVNARDASLAEALNQAIMIAGFTK